MKLIEGDDLQYPWVEFVQVGGECISRCWLFEWGKTDQPLDFWAYLVWQTRMVRKAWYDQLTFCTTVYQRYQRHPEYPMGVTQLEQRSWYFPRTGSNYQCSEVLIQPLQLAGNSSYGAPENHCSGGHRSVGNIKRCFSPFLVLASVCRSCSMKICAIDGLLFN